MEIIIQAILTIVNLICVVFMYKDKNYKIALFNAFAAGVCFAILINTIFNQ